jgi:hypothetical protein
MTLEDVLRSLQERLLQTVTERDRQNALALMTTFSVLRELSYSSENRALTGILVELENAARDVAMGERPKSLIPSLEAIQAAFTKL